MVFDSLYLISLRYDKRTARYAKTKGYYLEEVSLT